MWLRKRLASFLADAIIRRSIKTVIALVLFQGGTLAFYFRQLPPLVPLFYSLPWGETQLAPALYLLLFPIISLGVLLISFLITLVSPIEEIFLWRLVFIYSAFASFLTTVGLEKIIFLMS